MLSDVDAGRGDGVVGWVERESLGSRSCGLTWPGPSEHSQEICFSACFTLTSSSLLLPADVLIVKNSWESCRVIRGSISLSESRQILEFLVATCIMYHVSG